MNVFKCMISVCRKLNFLNMFYAVKFGRKPGVYTSWSECEVQVKGFPKPKYKKFPTEEQAWEFVNEQTSAKSYSSGSSGNTQNLETSSMSEWDKQAFSDAITSVKLTAQTLQSQMEMMSSTFDTMKKQLNHLEKLASAVNGRTFSSSSSSDSFYQFSDTNGGSARKRTPLKRSFTDGPYPVGPKSDVKKLKVDDDEEHWTGHRFDESEGVAVYTDGACTANGKYGARAGIGVYWGPGSENNISERLKGRPTNNRAEIHAARKAVEQAKEMGIKNLILYTDSMFLINSITKWIKGWKKNNWTLTTGKPVINRIDFEQLEAALKDMNIKWIYVRGHAGNLGNEAADALATSGAQKPLSHDFSDVDRVDD